MIPTSAAARAEAAARATRLGVAALLATAALGLSACGGSSGDDGAGPPDDGATSGGTAGEGTSDGGTSGDGDAAGDGATGEGALSPGGAGSTPPDAANADGGPASCGRAVPCAWASADGVLTFVLSAAQGERADDSGKLRVDLLASATSEVEIALLTSSTATVDDTELSVALATLGEEISGFSDRATASIAPSDDGGGALALAASLEFFAAAPEAASALDTVTVDWRDPMGAPVQAVFTDVPLGGRVPNTVDCALALPCTWSEAAAEPLGRSAPGIDITLIALETRDIEGVRRLAADFRVSTDRALRVATDGYSHALTAGGQTLGSAVISIGEEISRFGAPIETALEAGESIDGTVSFEGLAGDADTAVDGLRLNVFDAAVPRVPRWNPVFGAVPLGGR